MGLYIHVPFCKKKCSYCDFLSFLLPCEDMVADYILGVKKELELSASITGHPKVTSIYMGGGTPSILSLQFLSDIVSAVKHYFPNTYYREITIEANPGTLTRQKLRQILSTGVNRLSFGVQAMDDKLLQKMGRLHTAKETEEAFFLARQEGVNNISIDLMYGLPGQTPEDWRNTLNSVIKLNPEHVSAYGLTLEQNTPWGTLFSQGKLILPDEEECAQMYQLCREILSGAGFVQYEISNFSKPGFECMHNLGYWYRHPYIGVGLGASSFYGDSRYKNLTDFEAYLESVNSGVLPVAEKEKISREQAYSETMFLGLRTAVGINTLEFASVFGITVDEVFYPILRQLESAGVLLREDNWLRLNPDFYAVSNEVFQKFV